MTPEDQLYPVCMSTPTRPLPATVEGFSARNAKRTAASIAAEMRDLADRIDREAEYFDKVGTSGVRTYASVAGDIQQKVYNTLANAGFGKMIQEAGEADRARGAGE